VHDDPIEDGGAVMPSCAAVVRMTLSSLLVAVWCVGSASAQPLPWRTEEPLIGGWSFTPGASLGAAWDSGVQTGSNPVVETLFQKYVGRANPHAEIDFRGGRTNFNAGYSGAIEKYWGSGSGYEQYGRMSVSRAITPRFTASGDASYSAAPSADRLLVGDQSAPILDANIPFAEVDASYSSAGAGFGWRASPRVTVNAAYQFQAIGLDYDETQGPLETLRDGRSHGPSLTIMRAFTPRLSVGGSAEYRLEIITDSEDFEVQTASAAFSYRVSPLTTISGGGGASRLIVLGAGNSTTAPTFHGGFAHTRQRYTLGASYSRGFHQLYGFGSLATSDTFSVDASAPLMDRTYYLSALVAYSRSRAVEDVALGFDLDTLWINAGVGRRVNEWLKAEGYITVSAQNSALRGDGNRARVGIQLVTSKPMRMQ
jgi:hypothetical protein